MSHMEERDGLWSQKDLVSNFSLISYRLCDVITLPIPICKMQPSLWILLLKFNELETNQCFSFSQSIKVNTKNKQPKRCTQQSLSSINAASDFNLLFVSYVSPQPSTVGRIMLSFPSPTITTQRYTSPNPQNL